MRSGLNNFEIQRANRSLVLKLMLEVERITRAELAQKTKLKKSTITNIINELLELGIIEEKGMAQSDYGRPGELLKLNVMDAYIVSIAINRKNYKIYLYDLRGVTFLQIEGKIFIERDIEITINEIKEQISKIINQYGKVNIIGMCVALPGPYIRNEMDIAYVTGFEQLSRINVGKELRNAFQIPVFTEHDVKLSAFAEWKNISSAYNSSELSLVVLSSIGIGIGAGIVINGRIVKGVLGIAGEIGHMGINFNGARMEFGNVGSYEQYAGTDASYKYMLTRLHEYPNTELTESSTYKDIVQAYFKGDELAVWAMEKVAWMLAYGIINIIYILNPSIIIIEADYPNCDSFINKIRDVVKSNVHPTIFESVSIQFSTLEKDSVLLGGYYYAIENFVKNQQLLECITKIVTNRKAESK